MAEFNEAQKPSIYKEVANRLIKTIFNQPISDGQIVLLAAETNATITKNKVDTELSLPNGSKFVISNEGRLLSNATPIPSNNVRFEGEPAGHRTDYTYNFTEGGENEKVVSIGSFVLPDGRIIKEFRREFFKSGKKGETQFYEHGTEKLSPPNEDGIDLKDSKGKGVPFSINPK